MNIHMVRNRTHPRSGTSSIVLLLVILSYTERMPANDSATLQHALNPNKEGEAVANRLFFISFHF